ncbi:hypothetical protein ALI22I_20420 [Saccharothrix sp. ALI-22-I]|uniref:hypothetical protein n=1 Tax=Saccharothrix sp. ALI-22-I TaxID=1933778 RepID=UPI00097C2A5C|nr:hypothetical protein [Saccharothrix sp. ALI-22-I]ONI88106.1 hypothetical protein ALI22I_20420 [Saccharothrix sp. ALI-22-I]
MTKHPQPPHRPNDYARRKVNRIFWYAMGGAFTLVMGGAIGLLAVALELVPDAVAAKVTGMMWTSVAVGASILLVEGLTLVVANGGPTTDVRRRT